MRKIFVGAIVAAALVTIAGRSSTGTTRATTSSRPSVPTTTTEARPARTHTATRSVRSPVTRTSPPSTTPSSTTSTAPVRPVVTIAASPTPPRRAVTRTTSPPTSAQLAVLRAKALEACLTLARANNSRVVAANAVWYRQQLHALGAHAKPSNARYVELVANEDETQIAMSAQYSIDVSNCYLKNA
jgi:hypothetical protein